MGIINERKISENANNNIYDKQTNKDKLDNLKCKYHLENILSYIKDESFRLKFFVHSKGYQKILNIKKIIIGLNFLNKKELI